MRNLVSFLITFLDSNKNYDYGHSSNLSVNPITNPVNSYNFNSYRQGQTQSRESNRERMAQRGNMIINNH
jgi:hypothetical protein